MKTLASFAGTECQGRRYTDTAGNHSVDMSPRGVRGSYVIDRNVGFPNSVKCTPSSTLLNPTMDMSIGSEQDLRHAVECVSVSLVTDLPKITLEHHRCGQVGRPGTNGGTAYEPPECF